jgi:hypothetical protein
MVLAASRLPPTALATDPPRVRVSELSPFAAASSSRGVFSLISVGMAA